MTRKFANLKPREVVRALEKAGFFIHETSGSHVHLKHPAKPAGLPCPITSAFTCQHIVKSILRQAGLTNKEFFGLLDE